MQGDGSLVVGGTREVSDNNTVDFMACRLDSNNNGTVISTWKVNRVGQGYEECYLIGSQFPSIASLGDFSVLRIRTVRFKSEQYGFVAPYET